MDDHTFCLLRSLEDKIRRAAILIEQHQIHKSTSPSSMLPNALQRVTS